MSGGNWEYVMGVVTVNNRLVSGRNNKLNSEFNGIYGAPESDESGASQLEKTDGIDYPDSRYYNLYPYKYELNTDNWYDYTIGLVGDATKEIANTKTSTSGGNSGLWFGDSAVFSAAASPWFGRGGSFGGGSLAGVFVFNRAAGVTSSYYASRLVLAY